MGHFRQLMQVQNAGRVKLRLKELIEERQGTRNELARTIGARFEVIDKWCKDDVEKLDLDVLARICYVLGCDISDILQYERPEENEDKMDGA